MTKLEEIAVYFYVFVLVLIIFFAPRYGFAQACEAQCLAQINNTEKYEFCCECASDCAKEFPVNSAEYQQCFLDEKCLGGAKGEEPETTTPQMSGPCECEVLSDCNKGEMCFQNSCFFFEDAKWKPSDKCEPKKHDETPPGGINWDDYCPEAENACAGYDPESPMFKKCVKDACDDMDFGADGSTSGGYDGPGDTAITCPCLMSSQCFSNSGEYCGAGGICMTGQGKAATQCKQGTGSGSGSGSSTSGGGDPATKYCSKAASSCSSQGNAFWACAESACGSKTMCVNAYTTCQSQLTNFQNCVETACAINDEEKCNEAGLCGKEYPPGEGFKYIPYSGNFQGTGKDRGGHGQIESDAGKLNQYTDSGPLPGDFQKGDLEGAYTNSNAPGGPANYTLAEPQDKLREFVKKTLSKCFNGSKQERELLDALVKKVYSTHKLYMPGGQVPPNPNMLCSDPAVMGLKTLYLGAPETTGFSTGGGTTTTAPKLNDGASSGGGIIQNPGGVQFIQ